MTCGVGAVDKETVLAMVRTMAKVTSKLQVTIPKTIAEQYGIKPGDEITWVPAGPNIVVLPATVHAAIFPVEERLRLFDESRVRQIRREEGRTYPPCGGDRGWTREELYRRGRAD